jgi:hypothetical protein
MGIINLIKNMWNYGKLDEELKIFAKSGDYAKSNKDLESSSGEGYEQLAYPSAISMSSFNLFYNNYISKAYANEVDKIYGYRSMAEMPEISDVIEDAVIEATREDTNGKIVHIDIIDEEMRKNENITKNIEQEFEHLFYNKIKIVDILNDLFRTYFIDGRLYYERLVNTSKKSDGIVGIKKLPSETMDFEYDPKTLRILKFFQYLTKQARRPKPDEPNPQGVLSFYPEQIGFVDYGTYGHSRYDILGFLDKVKIPYNQLKLLETSVIIYRIVRAPERLVFKIDTGQMPRDKAIKYVEEVKSRMVKKQAYDPSTGILTNSPEVMSILDNYYIPTCLSLDTDILTMGGMKTLNRIIKEYSNGAENDVFVFDKNSNIYSAKIKWAGITKKDTEVIKVNLDNNSNIVCTPNHKFILTDGQEIEAQFLQSNMQLASYTSIVKIDNIVKLSIKMDTGCIEVDHPNHNFLLGCGIFVKNSSDGRGSSIETVGGNPSGFAELGDVHYFLRKLYKSLKYPMSRVTAQESHQEAGIVFSNSPVGEISKDEVKWATFLERHQNIFCNEFRKLFLLHLEFRGIKKEYGIDISKIKIKMNQPSYYKDRQEQLMLESRFSNYNALGNNQEFGKSFLMERYLDLTEEEIQANADSLKRDVELGFREPPMSMMQQEMPTEEMPTEEMEKREKSEENKNSINI